MSVYKLLLVEDKANAVEMLRLNLRDDPFELHVAHDGIEGEVQFRMVKPDLVILDINLPKMDGMTLCKRLRAQSNVPILMVTARVDVIDKAVALGLGADDYITKPYSPIELIARVKALLRRSQRYQEPMQTLPVLGGHRLAIDPMKHRVTLDGRTIPLSPLEYDLLHILVSHPGWAFTRAHLLEKVWGYTHDAGEETVTVHISNLRQKLGDDGSALIKTVRGVGYAYEEDEGDGEDEESVT